MTFGDYQEGATKTASYPDIGNNIIYPSLGLAEEAGEVAGKAKKLWRNFGITSGCDLPPELKDPIMKEMGDALWYIAALCNEMGIKMADVAQANLDKLKDRQSRGVIKSEGDNR